MTKKLLVLLACVGLTSNLVSCTSNDTPPESTVASDFDSADLEALDGEESAEAETAEGDSSLAATDELPADMLGESESSTEEVVATEMENSAEGTDIADADLGVDDLGADPLAATSDIPGEEPGAADVASSDTTYSDTSAFESTPSAEVASSDSTYSDSYSNDTTSSYSSSSTTYVDSGSDYSAPANVPLQKMATAPWKQGGVWYNAIYFARPGDTLSSISEAIYGSNKVAMLKKGNPTFQRRGVKPGDKVYYNSPNRPDDSSRLLTYYEDNGIAPEVHTAQAGDNIRTVSKQLLGYSEAWKEVWSSNLDVDSKGTLAEAVQLKYWSAGLNKSAAPAAPVMDLAQSAPAEVAPPAQDMAMTPPPPMEDQAMNDMPPPPPTDPGMDPSMGGQDMAMNEMPPPPPADFSNEMAPPPPPMEMPEANAQAGVDEEEAGGLGEDQMTIIGGIGIAVGLLAVVMIRNKRRKRDLEMQAMDNTHVGT